MNNIKFPILKSFIDNDLYKFTMQNAVVKLFPSVIVKYVFINRGNHLFPKEFSNLLKNSINSMINLKFTNEERIFFEKNFSYLDNSYLDFLQKYRYDPNEIKISQINGKLKIFIEGFWYRTILWEVPLMSIISELYNIFYNNISKQQIIDNISFKIKKYKKLNVPIAEFGTRRRYSYKSHKLIIEKLQEEKNNFFIGSSNVHLSHLFNIPTIGTNSHEWVMFHGSKYGFNIANKLALENWIHIYPYNLKIAISDTYTTPVFFKIFNKNFANFFDGIRHDSGDPISFTKITIEHYKKLKINPLNKIIFFSDSLNIKKISKIVKLYNNKIKMYFGVGTNFTNDFGINAMNIVIKMINILSKKGKWINVIKLSDVPEKQTGNNQTIKLAKKIFNIY